MRVKETLRRLECRMCLEVPWTYYDARLDSSLERRPPISSLAAGYETGAMPRDQEGDWARATSRSCGGGGEGGGAFNKN